MQARQYTSPPFGALREEFTRWLLHEGAADRTADSYVKRLGKVERSLTGSCRLLEASAAQLARVFSDASTQGTARSYWIACRRFYAFAVASGLRSDDPTLDLSPAVSRKVGKPQTWTEAIPARLRKPQLAAPEWERQFTVYLLATGRARRSAVTYVSAARKWRRFAEAEQGDPDAFDVSLVHAWLASVRQSVSSNTAARDLAAVRAYAGWIASLRGVPDADTLLPRGLRVKRHTVRVTPALALSDVERLLRAARGDRDRLILLTMLQAGLRVSELASLAVRDIDPVAGVLHVRSGKGDKDRAVRPPVALLEGLLQFIGRRQGPVFINARGQALHPNTIRRLCYEIALEAGVIRFHPHRLRSTFAVTFIRQLRDVASLQVVLGHAHLSTTARYLETEKETRALEVMGELTWPEEIAS